MLRKNIEPWPQDKNEIRNINSSIIFWPKTMVPLGHSQAPAGRLPVLFKSHSKNHLTTAVREGWQGFLDSLAMNELRTIVLAPGEKILDARCLSGDHNSYDSARDGF